MLHVGNIYLHFLLEVTISPTVGKQSIHGFYRIRFLHFEPSNWAIGKPGTLPTYGVGTLQAEGGKLWQLGSEKSEDR